MQRRRVSLSDVKTYKTTQTCFCSSNVTFELQCAERRLKTLILISVGETTSGGKFWKLLHEIWRGNFGILIHQVFEVRSFEEYFFWRVTCFYSLLRNAVNLSYVYKTDLAWWVSLADFTAVSSAAEKQKWVSGFGHFKTRKETFMLKCWNEIWGAGLDLPHVELCKRNRRFARRLSTSSVFSMPPENTE